MSVLPSTPGLQTTFDDNNDDLLHLLTDAWDNPLKNTITDSKWTRDYLTKLTSLPLNELLHEPIELLQEQAKAKRDAQQLAFRNYPSFLHAQTCRHEAEETLDGLDVHLGEFLTSVPELQQACEEFEYSAKTLKEERGKITSVLEHQNVLTDLLEIPQLMETCVWNGYYSEAMDLASHVRLLQVRYPLSVIKSIQQQVQASSDLMLVQLVSHVRKPIRLAAAMNVVGFLRRMDVFESETELRMVFLRCRHDFLQQRLVRVKRDMSTDDMRQRSTDAFEYLKRYIDVMREQMFEIGTQYISIFSSNEQQGATLLSDYMVHITGLIKSTLATYLPMIEDTSALASLLTQLQYCGMSLGRIGLDFRHVFVHSFEEAVQPMILRWIDASTEDLVKLIVKSTEELAAPSTWMSSKIVSQQNNSEQRRNAFQPPMLLVGYPSLAIFTNGILSAFNALRLLPAVSLYAPIQMHLEACFLDIGNALKQYSDQAASHIPDEITYLQSFTAAYVRCCIPYLKSCLVDGIYGDLALPSAADQDLDLLLVDYLPVIKKEEGKEEESEGLHKEGKQVLDIDEKKEELDHVKNTIVDEAPAVEDKQEDLDSNDVIKQEVDVEENSTKMEEKVEEENKEEIHEKQLEEEKKEVTNDENLINPNEEIANNEEALKDDISNDSIAAPTIEVLVIKENNVQQESTTELPAAEQSTTGKPISEEPIVEEKPVATEEKPVVTEEKPVVTEEKPVVTEEKPTVVEEKNAEEPAVEEDSARTEDKPVESAVEIAESETATDENNNSIETPVMDQPIDNPAAAKEEIGSAVTAQLPKNEEQNNTQVEEQLQQPSTTEHIDEEEHEKEEEEESTTAGTVAPEKKPQPQQQKKSKKHKGKKGRR
jgi:hypothetical protein